MAALAAIVAFMVVDVGVSAWALRMQRIIDAYHVREFRDPPPAADWRGGAPHW